MGGNITMRIKNKVTGEIKEIGPEQASQYGVGSTITPTSTPSPDLNTQPDQGFLEKLIRGNIIPASTAGLTGLIGTGAGIATGGLPALALGPASVGGGYIAGQGIKSILARLMGYGLGQQDPINNLTQDPNPMKAAGTDLAFRLGGGVLNFLKAPNKSLGGALDYLVGKNPASVNLGDIATEFKNKATPLTESLTQGGQYSRGIKKIIANLLNKPQDRSGEITDTLSAVNNLRKLTGSEGFGSDSAGYVNQKLSQVMYPLLREAITKNEPFATPILGTQSMLSGLSNFAEHIPFGLNRFLSALGRIGRPVIGTTLGAGQGLVENPLTRSTLMQYLLSQPNEINQTGQ